MINVLIISLLTWLTYGAALSTGYVSDDIDGLVNYDGKLKKRDYGHWIKWALHKVLGKSAVLNHIFSVVAHNIASVLLYTFLITFLPTKAALFSTILFTVHPITSQAVAWISGRGYPISMILLLSGLNLISYTPPLNNINTPLALGVFVLFCFCYYFSIHALLAVLTSFVLYAFMGHYFLALVGIVISLYLGKSIVSEVVGVRKEEFIKQDLGRSTKLHPRKIIVVFKSLAYYTLLAFFPRRLGLYHTYQYHYSDKTEKVDGMFWLGLLFSFLSLVLFCYGTFAVRFALLWYYCFIAVFLNWITIHQFVSERYLYVPLAGLCVLAGMSLVNSPLLFAFIVGLLMMRTMQHHQTYCDNIYFYQSNIWNFPDSEVAFGNLGVAYMNAHLNGSAGDMWKISTKINPEYDVGWYNLSSIYKQSGQLEKAYEHLKKAVESPLCHFKEQWGKELVQLQVEIDYVKQYYEVKGKLNKEILDPDKRDQAQKLLDELEGVNTLHMKIDQQRQKDIELVKQDYSSLAVHKVKLDQAKVELEKSISMEQMVAMRTNSFKVLEDKLRGFVSEDTKGGVREERLPGQSDPSPHGQVGTAEHTEDK